MFLKVKLTEMNMDLEEGYDTKSNKTYDFLFFNSIRKKEDNFEVTVGFLEFFLALHFCTCRIQWNGTGVVVQQ